MNAKLFPTLMAASLFCLFAAGQTKLVEEVTRKGDEIVIPYQKYQLANGLTLIIHEDHSDPVVHVDVTYHVGSAREELNKSGFAHFFEHMMFQGSENVGDEEHFKIVSESGGTLNGTTNRDRTNYFETVPSNQLETVLWLEADRMGFLLDAVTQEKFEVQRSTVKNEKGQNVNNRPYGLWREINSKALYPYGHPYSWTTIGTVEDLDRVDVNDLKRFFMRWYGPNNATLTVGGHVDPPKVVALVEKYFGVIPRGPEVKKMKLPLPQVTEDRYVSYVDNNIRFPGLLFTFPTVPRYHADEAALDCLAEVIGRGKKSYFYKKFVQTQKAIQASVFNSNDELSGEMTMFVLPYPGKSLSDFEMEMREALNEFEKAGVKDEDIEKFKASFEANTINGLESVRGKVSRLAAHQTFAGNPNQIQKDLNAYASVTKADVMRVYNTYVKGKKGVILSILPKGQESAPAKADNFTVSKEGFKPPPADAYGNLTYKRPSGDKFDRSVRPKPGKSPLVSVPEFWTAEWKNGIEIIGTHTSELPTISLQLNLLGGQKLDAFNPSKAGLANLTASMMNESTQNYPADEIAEKLEMLGSTITFNSDRDSTTVFVRSLAKNIDKTLVLLEEKLLRPKFTADDFARLKKQQLEGVKAQMKRPSGIADMAFNRLLYGKDHIRSKPVTGWEENIEQIQLADIQAFYDRYYSPSKCELVVVGALSKTDILGKLGFLKQWQAKKIEFPAQPETPKIDQTQIFLVDKSRAPQSEIRIGYLTGLRYDATGEFFKTTLMNYVLGGNFNSRINLNLREDKGYTYGARGVFRSDEDTGTYVARAGVRADVTDKSVVEFMKELTLYSEKGIAEDELQFMKNSIGQRDALNYETPNQKARFLGRIVHYDLKKDYVARQNEIIEAITKKEVDALARKRLPVDKMNILVVGDKSQVGEGLSKLNYPMFQLDERGEFIESNVERKPIGDQ